MDDHIDFEMGLSSLWRPTRGKSRAVNAENFTGVKGKGGMAVHGAWEDAARELGQGWKVSPCVDVPAGTTFTMADIDGPGAIQSIWMHGVDDKSRTSILRIYWDHQDQPSVECPVNDFFAKGWPGYAALNSIPVAVNAHRGLNCYWVMPFHQHCRITFENYSTEPIVCFYQVNYTLDDIPQDAAYFHAQFRRVNPLPYKSVYTILDGVCGRGHYIGTYLAMGVTNNGWWGEGEVKFYIDGDREFPTICTTGTEDYFGGSYNFDVNGKYTPFSTPYMGMHQLSTPDGTYQSQQRFSMYRWHVMDPIRFENDLRLTIQALGWRSGGRYLPLQCDIATVAYWYQTLPTVPFPQLPDKDYLEII